MAISSLVLFSSYASALEITEVEQNPEGKDSGNEWIEIYSEEETELEGYYFENSKGKTQNISGKIKGYFVFESEVRWINNDDEKISLKKGASVIDETSVLEDKENDNFSWSKCEDGWVFSESSEGKENICEEDEIEENMEEEAEKDMDEEDDFSNAGEIIEIRKNQEDIFAPLNPKKEVEKEIMAEQEKIVLNSPINDKNENAERVFVSKEDKIRNGFLYGFLGFVVLVAILIALRKL